MTDTTERLKDTVRVEEFGVHAQVELALVRLEELRPPVEVEQFA
jgi:hypothetical protein